MVQQRGNPLPPRDFYSPNNWPPSERSFHDASHQEGRFTAMPAHARNLSIEEALRECVRIPVKDFALAVILDSGEEKIYTSQSLTPHQTRILLSHFREDFSRYVRRADGEGSYPKSAYGHDPTYSEFDVDSGPDPRRQSSSGDSSSGSQRRHNMRQPRTDESDGEDSTSAKTRKRHRGLLYPTRYADHSNDDTPVPVAVQKTQQLKIGDDVEVKKFYDIRFRNMQQSSCKVMGKAFVKLVEPKKQTHHPYTKGDVKAPPWWPPTQGEDRVRHKEPDHLLKPERIRLLVWILRMVTEPYAKQHPTVQKLGLNVKKLEDATMEAMSNWFNDQEHPENASKRPYLKEIFKVAKAEERYKNGEIDDTTMIPVMLGDGSGLDGSDDEIDEGIKYEDDDQDSTPVSARLPTPDSIVSPSMLQNPHLQPRPDNSESTNSFMLGMRPLPVRYHTNPSLEDHPSYTDSSYLPRTVGVGFQQSPTLHDPNRRSFASSNFQSPQQNMYGWQTSGNNLVSNGPVTPNYYVSTPPQSALNPPTATYQLPLPNSQQNMLPPPPLVGGGHHFDGLSNAGRQYEGGIGSQGIGQGGQGIGGQLRTGSVGHPHQMPQHHGFQDYLQDNGNSGVGYGGHAGHVGEGEMKDEGMRGS